MPRVELNVQAPDFTLDDLTARACLLPTTKIKRT